MSGWLGSWLERAKSRAAGGDAAASPVPPVAAGPLALFDARLFREAQESADARLQDLPGDAEGLYVRGLLALEGGKFADGQKVLEQLVGVQPDHAQAWIALGRARAQAGRKAASREALLKAQALAPDHPELLAELALAALAEGKFEAATGLLGRLGRGGGGLRAAEAHFQAASALLQRKETEGAQRHLRAAIASDDRHAHAHANLGAMLKDAAQADAARAALARALQLDPGLSQAAYNLAMLDLLRRDWAGAVVLLRQSIAADARDADAHYWLGNALMGVGDAVEARKAYQAALRLQAGHLNARWGAAMAQLPAVAMEKNEQTEAAQGFGREIDKLKAWVRTHRPANAQQAVGAQQPYYLAYIEQNHRDVLDRYGQLCTSLMADWARKTGVPAPAAPSGGKLRLGIVSAHIHSHSVWHAILRGWVEHLDRNQFELQVFHTGTVRDAETQWAVQHVAKLHHNLGEWPAWAQAISGARCDVLVYPEIGMDSTTVRLASLRLARTQLASWGHPVTTGLPTIDAYISAQAFEPEGASAHYTEQLVTLPRLGCAYRPYNLRPGTVDLAAWNIAPGDRLLLCAGNAFKYAPRDDALLVDIARRCQPCKLVFFGKAADFKTDLLERRLRAAFAAEGVDFEACVRFVPWQTQENFFALLKRANVFLDSAGFSGFNTAMQAIECDTPIVAWEGQFMRGRFASAILRELGLGEWVASTPGGFAALVETLCTDSERRRAVKDHVRAHKAGLFQDKASVDAFAAWLLTLRTP